MSADNWTTCPKCDATLAEAIEKAEEKLAAIYGKVSVEKFNVEQKAIQAIKAQPREATMREDYDIGIDEDVFRVDFRASCNVCRFSFEYKFEQQCAQH